MTNEFKEMFQQHIDSVRDQISNMVNDKVQLCLNEALDTKIAEKVDARITNTVNQISLTLIERIHQVDNELR